MNKSIIRSVKDLPSWFNLDKYESSKSLDATGWYEQLSVRSHFKSFLEGYSNDGTESSEQVTRALEIFRESPIINLNKTATLMKILFMSHPLYELKTEKPKYTLGVHLTTINEFYRVERKVEYDKRSYARKFFTQNFTKYRIPNDIKYSHQDWMEYPIDDLTQSNFINLTVDLSLPNKNLIQQFEILLNNLRGELAQEDISFDNKLRLDFESWIKFGVLPYLDLCAWAEIENIQIPNRVMADAIFKDGEGGEEVVRKTTQKICDEILTEINLNKLASFAATEIAERNI